MTFQKLLLIAAIAAPTGFVVASTASATPALMVGAAYVQDGDEAKKMKAHKKDKKAYKKDKMKKKHMMSDEMKAKHEKCDAMKGEDKASCMKDLKENAMKMHKDGKGKKMHKKMHKDGKDGMKMHKDGKKMNKDDMKKHKEKMGKHKRDMKKEKMEKDDD